MDNLKELIREIHRRSLWQVLSIYAIGSWFVYQVILGLTEGGILPEWFPGVAVGLFLVGLPIVLATAFVQEGLPRSGGSAPSFPEGDAEPDGPHGAPTPAAARPTARPLAGRLEWLLTWHRAIAVGVLVFLIAGLVAVVKPGNGGSSGTGSPSTDRSIAVLPLENMSADPDDAYFTDGIHEEIISRLFQIDDVRTVARASVMAYRNTDSTLDQKAQALGVRYLLVGSVRRADERSRVAVSLVEPGTGEQLWADTYEVRGTDVFEVQAAIARNVATALEAELTPGTRERLAVVPTTSSPAYDDYLRARDFHQRSYGRDNVEAATRHYERAVATDPEFAVAHARLGEAHIQHFWFHYDRSPARLERARRHIDRALELDPTLPEGHLAMARYHYWGQLAFQDALDRLDIAAAEMPGNPDIALIRGSIHRRAGQFQEAIRSYEESTRLDPNAWPSWWNLGETYALVRRYDDAIAAADHAARGGLNVADAWVFKAHVRLHGLGLPAAALATLDSVSANLATGEYSPVHVETMAHLFLAQYDHALEALYTRPAIDNQFYFRPPSLMRGLIHHHAGDATAAAAAFDSARVALDRVLQDRRPDDVRAVSALAIALAGLGRVDDALDLAERAVQLLPPEREAWRGAVKVHGQAAVQAMTGRHREAVENLEWLLSTPSPLSRAALRLDPTWDPLRDRADFQALLATPGS